MNGGDRTALEMPSFGVDTPNHRTDGLEDFAPRSASKSTDSSRKAIDEVSQFPSREASPDAQMNLKGPKHVLDRFKAMCKTDRRAYYDMLEVLMDEYDHRSG